MKYIVGKIGSRSILLEIFNPYCMGVQKLMTDFGIGRENATIRYEEIACCYHRSRGYEPVVATWTPC